jgi:tRNA dimethylallyltransferase
MGPTAAGKTDLAVKLVAHLPCEIISVDSALVYRSMDIGTAKPNRSILAAMPHHLIDLLDPAQAYSAGQFRQDALALMSRITAAGRIPLLVGGTMLYFKALQEGLADLPVANAKVRAHLQAQVNEFGLPALHKRLQSLDPVAAERINSNDSQRLLRALEIITLTGTNQTDYWRRQQRLSLPYDIITIGIWPADRSLLHQRIEQRFHMILAAGFETEVKALRSRTDLHSALPAMRCVGYRQMWQYLAGDVTHSDMVYKSVVATRQLAKRQLTWLRHWPNLQYYDALDINITSNVLKLLARIPI